MVDKMVDKMAPCLAVMMGMRWELRMVVKLDLLDLQMVEVMVSMDNIDSDSYLNKNKPLDK